MSVEAATAVAMAGIFAIFTGFNDAGVLVGVGVNGRGLRPTGALSLLTAAVLAAPLLVGTAVATTLDGRLVSGGDAGSDGRVEMLCGIAAAVAVTLLLAARRLPTSLTLALIGGISGAGVGGGLGAPGGMAPHWTVVLAVLAAAAAAPFVGGLAALAAGRLFALLPLTHRAGGAAERLRWLHAGGFFAACLAYGANDGQKMLAVYAVLLNGDPGQYAQSPSALLLIATCFLAGGLAGVHRIGAAGGGLTTTRPDGVVMTELSSAGVVLGTAALGAPVSMTQSISGALVGAALTGGARRVRWRKVMTLGRAWLVTLPAAFVAGAVVTAAVSVVS